MGNLVSKYNDVYSLFIVSLQSQIYFCRVVTATIRQTTSISPIMNRAMNE